MDVFYQHGGLSFVWDAQKAASNLRKHGIRFESACEVFFDPLLQVVDAGVNEEARDAVVGESADGKLLFVVHLLLTDESLRLISVRTASSAERKAYENNS